MNDKHKCTGVCWADGCSSPTPDMPEKCGCYCHCERRFDDATIKHSDIHNHSAKCEHCCEPEIPDSSKECECQCHCKSRASIYHPVRTCECCQPNSSETPPSSSDKGILNNSPDRAKIEKGKTRNGEMFGHDVLEEIMSWDEHKRGWLMRELEVAFLQVERERIAKEVRSYLSQWSRHPKDEKFIQEKILSNKL